LGGEKARWLSELKKGFGLDLNFKVKANTKAVRGVYEFCG
jgi:hypothetical protein